MLIRQLDYEPTEVMRRANKIKVEPIRTTVQRVAERRGEA
jgi:hypothetical protein